MNDSFARLKTLSWRYFSTLHLSFHCFLVSTISACKLPVITGNHLYMIKFFSLLAFKILSLFLAFDILTMICLYINFFYFLLFGVHWPIWMCRLEGFFIKFGKFLKHFFKYLFKISSSFSPISSWHSSYLYVFTVNGIPHALFLFIFFLFLWITSTDIPFKFADSFLCQFKSSDEPL